MTKQDEKIPIASATYHGIKYQMVYDTEQGSLVIRFFLASNRWDNCFQHWFHGLEEKYESFIYDNLRTLNNENGNNNWEKHPDDILIRDIFPREQYYFWQFICGNNYFSWEQYCEKGKESILGGRLWHDDYFQQYKPAVSPSEIWKCKTCKHLLDNCDKIPCHGSQNNPPYAHWEAAGQSSVIQGNDMPAVTIEQHHCRTCRFSIINNNSHTVCEKPCGSGKLDAWQSCDTIMNPSDPMPSIIIQKACDTCQYAGLSVHDNLCSACYNYSQWLSNDKEVLSTAIPKNINIIGYKEETIELKRLKENAQIVLLRDENIQLNQQLIKVALDYNERLNEIAKKDEQYDALQKHHVAIDTANDQQIESLKKAIVDKEDTIDYFRRAATTDKNTIQKLEAENQVLNYGSTIRFKRPLFSKADKVVLMVLAIGIIGVALWSVIVMILSVINVRIDIRPILILLCNGIVVLIIVYWYAGGILASFASSDGNACPSPLKERLSPNAVYITRVFQYSSAIMWGITLLIGAVLFIIEVLVKSGILIIGS